MMRAGVWTGVGQLVCREWPEPELTDDGVLVRVHFCGMCGSDPHIVEGNLPVGPPPQVLGHEVSGVVEAVGSRVRGVEVGDRVACNFFGSCGGCPWCLVDQPNHCRNKTFGASGYAELATYRQGEVFVLPDDVDLAEGALLEPAATCLYAVEESGLRPGESALVLGAGPMGLLTAQLARLVGAGTVVVGEPDPAKRALATSLGVDLVVDPRDDDLVGLAKGIGPRRGFDVVFDAAGVPAASAQAIDLLATRGRLMVIAVHDRDATIPLSPFQLYAKELVVRSVYATAHTFARAVPLLPRLDLTPLITAIEPLSKIDEVYRRHRAGEYTKVLVDPRNPS